MRRGRLAEDNAGSDPFAAQAPRFASTAAASLQGRVALGPRAGQPLRRLRSAAAATATGPRAARLEGFSLNGVRYDGSWDESDLLAAVEAAAA